MLAFFTGCQIIEPEKFICILIRKNLNNISSALIKIRLLRHNLLTFLSMFVISDKLFYCRAIKMFPIMRKADCNK